MRSALVALILIAACGDNRATKTDGGGGGHTDGHASDGKMQDGTVTPVDATIGDVRAATDGTISLKLKDVVVTYIKPAIGNDVAGFYIQKDPTGPAIFVAVDPATLTPMPAAGDTISLTATEKKTVSAEPEISMLGDFADTAQGASLDALTQDVSAATDLVTAASNYDAELVTVTGTLTGASGSSGSGFVKFELDTAGIMTTPALQLRAPTALMNAIDMVGTCHIVATKIPFVQFSATAELTASRASEIQISGCPAPTVVSALAGSLTTVKITFSRNIDASTVLADGTQFTVSGGINVLANPVVSGRTVTITTDSQTPLTAYTVTVANTVKDLQGSAVANTLTANFAGYTQPAQLLINEVNANITSCDLMELRVKADGNTAGFKITERDGASVNYTLPAIQVHKNDFIVVHFQGTNATCNKGAVDELTTINAQPRATFANNFDSAYDIYTTTAAGLTDTTNVFTLFDPTGTIVDAVYTSDATSTAAPATITAAVAAFNAGQWTPNGADDTTFQASAVTDMDMCGNSQAGNTIQRMSDTDTNTKADWTSGAGAAPTWGALNVGEALFP